MTPEDFDRLQTLLATRAGFRLTRDRMHLAEHRLGRAADDPRQAAIELKRGAQGLTHLGPAPCQGKLCFGRQGIAGLGCHAAAPSRAPARLASDLSPCGTR